MITWWVQLHYDTAAFYCVIRSIPSFIPAFLQFWTKIRIEIQDSCCLPSFYRVYCGLHIFVVNLPKQHRILLKTGPQDITNLWLNSYMILHVKYKEFLRRVSLSSWSLLHLFPTTSGISDKFISLLLQGKKYVLLGQRNSVQRPIFLG